MYFSLKRIILVFIVLSFITNISYAKLAMEQINDIPWSKLIYSTIPATLRNMLESATGGPSTDGTVLGWDDNGYDTFTIASLEHFMTNGTARVSWRRLYDTPPSVAHMVTEATGGPSTNGSVKGWDDNGYTTFTIASLENFKTNGKAEVSWLRLIDIPDVIKAIYEGGSGGEKTVAFLQDFLESGMGVVHWTKLDGIPQSLVDMLSNAAGGPSADGTVPGWDDNGYDTFTIASLEHFLTNGTAKVSWNRLYDIPDVIRAIYEGGVGGSVTVAFLQDFLVDGTAIVHWNRLTGTPTTIAGYGITDAYTKTQVDTNITTHANSTSLHLSTAQNTVLDGLAAGLTATELNYVDGVTSSIQTQFNTINTQLGDINAALDIILN